MLQSRAWHSATVLQSGLVLVAGGIAVFDAPGNSTALNTADLYDPVSRSWKQTGSMRMPHAVHAAVLLNDGRVLVAGGCSGSVAVPRPGNMNAAVCLPIASAEVYDPVTGAWEPTPSMHHSRTSLGGGAVLMDGKVLIAGSWEISNPAQICEPSSWVYGAHSEVYDPAKGVWEEVGLMVTARTAPTMTRLGDGRVLAVGGFGSCAALVRYGVVSAEIYDPATRSWRSTAPFHREIGYNTLTMLPTGSVLLTSGCPADNWPCEQPLEKVGWLFNPATETWTATSATTFTRQYASAVLLRSGNVLVAGGNALLGNNFYSAPDGEVYDPWGDTWTRTPVIPHYQDGWGAAALLPSGEVLLTGGVVFNGIAWTYDNFNPIAAAQLYRER